MHFNIRMVVLFILATAPSLSPVISRANSLPVLVGSVDLGVVYPLAHVNVTATLHNTGPQPVRITRIASRNSRNESKVKFGSGMVKPNGSLAVEIDFDVPERTGGMSRMLDVYAGMPEQRIGEISIKGFVDWIVNPVTLVNDFGFWNVHEPIQKSLTFETRPGEDVRLTKVLSEGKYFRAVVAESGRSLVVTSLKSPPSWGVVDDSILVSTSSHSQSKLLFHLRGEARGEVVPSTYLVSFDPVRVGESPEQTVRVRDETGHRLNIGSVTVKGTTISSSVRDCVPVDDTCKFLTLSLPPQKLGEPPRGVIELALPDYQSVLAIHYTGVVIGKNTQIRNLNEEIEKSKERSADSPISISSVLKDATSSVSPLETPMPPGNSPLITWKIAGEGSVYGYEIYRASSESGTFSRVNDEIIRRLDSSPEQGSIYRWRDTSAKSGNTYWYYISIVYMTGEKKALTSAQKVVAK